jgi:hypothetical protein
MICLYGQQYYHWHRVDEHGNVYTSKQKQARFEITPSEYLKEHLQGLDYSFCALVDFPTFFSRIGEVTIPMVVGIGLEMDTEDEVLLQLMF